MCHVLCPRRVFVPSFCPELEKRCVITTRKGQAAAAFLSHFLVAHSDVYTLRGRRRNVDEINHSVLRHSEGIYTKTEETLRAISDRGWDGHTSELLFLHKGLASA